RLMAMSYDERVANPCIGSERADLVLAGCAILEAIRRAFSCRRPRGAGPGPRGGMLGEMMRAHGGWGAGWAGRGGERAAGGAGGAGRRAAGLGPGRSPNAPSGARARREGLRSRAAYKLIEMDDKHRFLKPGGRVVDLGAAPGGWSQIAAKRVGAEAGRGRVVAIDLLEMQPLAGVDVLRLDFLHADPPPP